MKSQIKRQNGGNCGAGSCPLQLGGHKQSRSIKRQSGRGCGCGGNVVPKLQLGGCNCKGNKSCPICKQLKGCKSKKQRKVKKSKSKSK